MPHSHLLTAALAFAALPGLADQAPPPQPAPVPEQTTLTVGGAGAPISLPSEPEAFASRLESLQGMQAMLTELTGLAGQVKDEESARRFLDAVVQSLQSDKPQNPGAQLVRLTPQHEAQLERCWDDIMDLNERFVSVCFDTITKVAARQGYGNEDLRRAYGFAMVMLISQQLPELKARQDRMNDMLRELHNAHRPEVAPSPAP